MHSRRKRSLVVWVVAILTSAILGLMVSGCGGDKQTNPPPGNVVTIHIVAGAMSKGALAYSPNPDTVSVSTTVRWMNDDSINHTATSDNPGTFNTGTIGAGQSRSIVFSTAGSFPYHCSIHPSMSGSLVVKP